LNVTNRAGRAKAGGKNALVVEGGGMRGIFSAGVLDGFMLAGYDPFDLYLGVSAGACNLASHLAGQYQRNFRLYTGPMSRPDFFSWRKFLLGGHYMDLDWFWLTHEQDDPLDVTAVMGRLKQVSFLPVCTSLMTGRGVFFEPEFHDLNDLLKASCSLPILYRTPLTIRGETLIDGGVSHAIPAQEAHRRGAMRIVVIRSQPENYVKAAGFESRLVRWHFRDNPALLKTVDKRLKAYKSTLDFIRRPPDGLQIESISPPERLRTSRTSTDLGDLICDYRLGREQAQRYLESLARVQSS
jgi:predicted patatin/cPLA2 family phospholipase